MGIVTNAVLELTVTKWNFLNFKPGLVGGHCIGVDPYYLAQKAQEVGYHPEIILAGSRINDTMGNYVATEVIKLMMRIFFRILNSKVLILGFTFKENCPDIRNTKVIEIVRELREFNILVDVYDNHADKDEVYHEYRIRLIDKISIKYSAIILAVAHSEFKLLNFNEIMSKNGVLFDSKSFIDRGLVDSRL